MPTSLPPGFTPPCVERGEQIAELRSDQRVLASEMKAMKMANDNDHKRLEDTLREVRSDVKDLVNLMNGGGGDDGFANRLRRVEENCVKQTDMEARLSTRESEANASNKTLFGVIVASGVALIASVVTGLFTYFTEIASGGGGGPTP